MSQWTRQPGETARAYAAFTKYLALGPERTVIAAYRLLSGRASAATVPGYVTAWSARNAWVERAEAFDVAQLEAQVARRGRELERVRQRFVDKAPAVADRLLELATDPAAEFGPHHVAAAKLALAHAGLAESAGSTVKVEGTAAPDGSARVVVHLVTPDNGRGPQGE